METKNDIKETFSWLKDSTPEFGIDGCQIEILTQPHEFFLALKAGIKHANRRIVLASLYLGTGNLETELVDTIYEKCQQSAQSSSGLHVKVLLDFTRGSRGDKNSRTMLLPLLKDFEDNVQVSLYHTPDLRGMLKRIIPDRYNETIGVSHLKVYLFDDTLIMSGANLSNDYFTNRQDRYIIIKDCPELANFFENLVSSVSEFSLQLMPDNTVCLSEKFSTHPFEDNDDGSKFKDEAYGKIMSFVNGDYSGKQTVAPGHNQPNDVEANKRSLKEIDTWIYPLVQMGPLGIKQDEIATNKLFQSASVSTNICLASGYFNLTEDYQNVILQSSKADFSVLMASPQAMGFFGARGAAGAVPQAYTHMAKQFSDKVIDNQSEERIKLFEFSRDGWTFHVKGLWYYLPGRTLPSLTFIGSPNLGYRSVHRDLEAQVAIVTENSKLCEELHKEKMKVHEYANEISRKTFNERHVRLWVRIVTRFFKSFF